MIVFIAAYPGLADPKDGMIQRIASIDSLVSELPRIYLDVSFRRFWKQRIHSFGQVTVFQVNGLRHFLFILSLVKSARIVYIHSVYNSMRLLPAYWVAKPITDLHGAVPEELAHQGKPWLAHLFGLVERVVLRSRAPVVHVTAAMRRHFEHKYQRRQSADRIIAILPELSDCRGDRANVLSSVRASHRVIYAGGLQAWQNIPMMLHAAAAAPELRYLLLSGEWVALQQLAEAAKVRDFECMAVAPPQVPDHYLTCTFGFLLRDPVLLNRVACPTKLAEYLYWGVIPVVLAPEVGDFAELGYAFVALADFVAGRLPNDTEAARMRSVNREVVDRLIQRSEIEISSLGHVLRND